MKFKMQREQMLRALQLVTSVVERRQTLPVLANILVVATEDRLEITGTDLEVQLVASCDATVEQPGAATMPARKLADIWRSLGDGSEVQVSIEKDRALVRSGRSRFTLATLPAADFPKIDVGEADTRLSISQDDLLTIIDEVGFAMAQQAVRYFLNGMLLEATPSHVRAVATDGHRLAMSTCEVSAMETGAGKSVIVPRKGVLELGRLLEGVDEKVALQIGDNHLQASVGTFTLTTKLVDGQFPDYQKVVPSGSSRSLVADRETLRQAFQRASILSNEKYRGVRLIIDGDQLVIQANNPEQEEAEETVSVEFAGTTLEIGFNVSYLLDVLGSLTTDAVKLSVSDANSSALLEGVGNDSALYVVMPMRL